MVVVEEYPHHIFILKFYLKEHKSHPDKYSILTDLHEASWVLGTCLRIAVAIIRKNPLASLGFIGAPTLEEIKNIVPSDKTPTKRFNIYTKLVARLFSPNDFLHVEDAPNSAYACITLKNGNPHQIRNLIGKMFHEHYILQSQPVEIEESDTVNISEQFQAR